MAELKNTIVNGVLNVNGDLIASKIIKRGDTGSILRGNGSVITIGTGTSKFLREDGTWATVSTSDTGATSIETTGTGNAVTSGSYDATTRKITLTKGGSFLPLAGGTMTGAIVRNYTAASTDPVLKIASHNFDVNIFKVYSGDQTYANTGVYGYNLVYNGTGSGVDNKLTLNCDDQNATTQVIGWQLNQAGQMGIGTSASTSYRLTVNGSANATTLYENGTSLANKYAAKGHNHDTAYLGKTTYEWNKEYAAGGNGAVSLGRYNLYDTQLTFDITTTTSATISGKLVIASQNGSIKKVTVYGDASNTLAGYLTIYQSAISSDNRSWVEVFCNFPGWSKNKVHIYGVALNSATVTRQMASVTFTGGVPSGVTSGDTKWTGTIVNDITAYDAGYSGIGTCTTAAAAAAKVVTLPRFALVTNATILVRVSTTNSATSGVTLNVNDTGAKSIYIGGSAWSTSNQLNAGDYLATYDGTYWKLTRIYLTDSNTTYGADRGISLVSGNYGHSNTAITDVTTAGLYKIKYDAYGHITGTESFSLPTQNSWDYDDRYVKYNAAQTLTSDEKTQARANIGAGTSSFSGSYNDLNNKPTIPNPANYYWANIKVSSSSSTATTPSVQKLGITGSTTATANAAVTMEYDSSYKALKFVFA